MFRSRAHSFAALLLAAAGALSATSARAQVVISQFYGSGGLASATYNKDYVELFNRTSSPVNLSTWSLQYAAASGTTWTTVNLAGQIPANGYYLIQLSGAASPGTGSPLPTPDLTFAGTLDIAATGGKLALVSNQITLSGPCFPVGSNGIVDLVGYGGAAAQTSPCFEGIGAAPPQGTSVLATFRKNNGCTDTNVNSADFLTGTPAPRNSDPSNTNICSSAANGACCIAFTAPAQCVITSSANCVSSLGGTYAGDGSTCPPGTYAVTASANAFASIATTGTVLGTLSSGTTDDGSWQIDLRSTADGGPAAPIANPSFSFIYFGQLKNVYRIGTNGWMAMSPTVSVSPTNAAFPNVAQPNDILAPYWDDLNLSTPASTGTGEAITQKVYYQLSGTAPNRTLIVQWQKVYNKVLTNTGTASVQNTFQIVLTETTNTIEYRYNGVAAQGAAVSTGGTAGNTTASFNIGMEDIGALNAVNVDTSAASFSPGNMLFTPTSNCPTLIACCAGGNCSAVDATSCAGIGGLSGGSSCSPNPCVQATGNCCAIGSCTITTQSGCSGSWTLNGSCSPNPCNAQCCPGDGTCSVGTQASCLGTWTSTAGSCTPNTCPQPIATCCNNTTGQCTFVYSGTCGTGTTSHTNLACNPTPCTPTGYCCNSSTGACSIIYGGTCGSGTTSITGPCQANSCPVTGICCNNSTGACTLLYVGSCATNTTQGTSTTCDTAIPSSSCAVVGTCCATADLSCTVIYGGTCTSGVAGTGTSCGGSPCSALGTCCSGTTGTTCSVTTQAGCTTNVWTASVGCTPNICAGSCCNNTTLACTSTSAAACTSGSTFAGNGTTCTTNPCPAPANDTCAGAIPIIVGSSTFGTNASATDDANPAGSGSCNTLSTFTKGVWYTFTDSSPVSRRLRMDLCDPVTNFDAEIYVFTSPTDCTGTMSCVWANATSGIGCPAQGSARWNSTPGVHTDIPSILNWTFTANNTTDIVTKGTTVTFADPPTNSIVVPTTYYILVTSQGTAGGQFVLHLVDTGESIPGTPPANNTCAGARPITSNPFWDDVYPFDSMDSTQVVSCNSPANSNSHGGLWYTYTPSESGNFAYTKIPDEATGKNGTVITFFTAAPDCSALTEISGGCTHATGGWGTFATPFLNNMTHLTAGTHYYIQVSLYDTTLTGISGLPQAWNLGFNFTPDPGACCTAGACSQTNGSAACTSGGGSYRGTGTTCSPNPCSGVCCRGSTCNATVSQASCTGNTLAGATFSSSSSTCNAPTSNTSPCCYPDYNKVGGISVQDIFDFLNDWFAGSKFAIVGGDGNTGTLNVQNIFDFLNAWFAGGC
jgi:hypothetical protein